MKKKNTRNNKKKEGKNTIEIIRQRVIARLSNELEQKGGSIGSILDTLQNTVDTIENTVFKALPYGPRENHFNPGLGGGSGSIGAILSNTANTIVNSFASIADSIGATISIAKLPLDLRSIASRPNEPLPSNTRLAKAIDYI